MPEASFDEILDAMKKAAGVMQRADVTFVLGGGLAAWARGGPKTEHDVDFMVRRQEIEQAVAAFEDQGYETEDPPEGWLRKTWVDGVLVDLIFDTAAGPVTDDTIGRAELLEVYALRILVASLEDVMITKLLALTEQEPEYSGVLELARAVREQVDWGVVRERTESSPLAKAFFTLVEELGVVDRETA